MRDAYAVSVHLVQTDLVRLVREHQAGPLGVHPVEDAGESLVVALTDRSGTGAAFFEHGHEEMAHATSAAAASQGFAGLRPVDQAIDGAKQQT
ncbi:hypothetical protein [Streptomyces sp. NPDC093089]|uniref:hypothetical protein n=1 Tax=Streptomyces sp. NPDC093089 TaxID=3366024 RepID=UPI00380074D9